MHWQPKSIKRGARRSTCMSFVYALTNCDDCDCNEPIAMNHMHPFLYLLSLKFVRTLTLIHTHTHSCNKFCNATAMYHGIRVSDSIPTVRIRTIDIRLNIHSKLNLTSFRRMRPKLLLSAIGMSRAAEATSHKPDTN